MASARNLTLLIVEDDARTRELAEAAAERSGCFRRIRTAAHGAAALDLLAEDGVNRPDVVLTDLSMPLLDGLELVRHIRAHPELRDIPVVMFSSSNRPNDREDALAAGCAAFFEKPGSLEGLKAIVLQACALAEERAHGVGGAPRRSH